MLTPERRAAIRALPVPAHRKQVEEIARLVPEREKAIWTLWNAGELLAKDAERILAEARKPRLLPTASSEAERLHMQSGEVLSYRHEEELRARVMQSERLQHTEAEWELARRQRIIDYWQEQKVAAAELERHFREDPIEAYDRGTIWRGCR
jgi:hypothetical protein